MATVTLTGLPLHQRIRRARAVADLSQVQLAERVGVSPRALQDYEAGNTEPSPSMVIRIALACGIDPDEMFIGLHPWPEPTPAVLDRRRTRSEQATRTTRWMCATPAQLALAA